MTKGHEQLAANTRRRLARSGGGTQPVDNPAPGRPPFCLVLPTLRFPEPQPVYGQYPVGFIAKILPLLECSRHRILHVCSGSLPFGEGIRVDIRPAAQPDIVADGRCLPLADSCVDAVLIDPPYSADYARELYSTSYPRPAHLLREAARVVKPCGRIGIVHYLVPKPPPDTRWVMTRGLSVGFGFPMRALTIYQRRQDGLEGFMNCTHPDCGAPLAPQGVYCEAHLRAYRQHNDDRCDPSSCDFCGLLFVVEYWDHDDPGWYYHDVVTPEKRFGPYTSKEEASEFARGLG